MKKVLLVVDVQNCFINNKTRTIPIKIAKHIENNKYDFVLFTQFINKPHSQFATKFNWKEAFDSPSIDISQKLQPLIKRGRLFQKSTYSAFKSKRLLNFLKSKNLKNIDICGLDVDSCILATAYEGFDLGFNVKVVPALTACMNKIELYNSTLEILKRNIQK